MKGEKRNVIGESAAKLAWLTVAAGGAVILGGALSGIDGTIDFEFGFDPVDGYGPGEWGLLTLAGIAGATLFGAGTYKLFEKKQ